MESLRSVFPLIYAFFFDAHCISDESRILFVRFEDFAAVTMKNVVFWDIKVQFLPHRKHITSPLQSPEG
jgi:hypothetical protein